MFKARTAGQGNQGNREELFQDQGNPKDAAGASSKGREDSDLPDVVFVVIFSCCCQLELSPKILDQFQSRSTGFGGFVHTEPGSSPITDMEVKKVWNWNTGLCVSRQCLAKL